MTEKHSPFYAYWREKDKDVLFTVYYPDGREIDIRVENLPFVVNESDVRIELHYPMEMIKALLALEFKQ